MKRIFKFSFLFLLLFSQAKGQVNNEMELFYSKLMRNSSITDQEKLAKGDSILKVAKDDHSKVFAYFIIANSYMYANDYDNGYKNIMKADSIIDRNNFPKEKIRSYNMQNGVYNVLKLYTKYEDNIKKVDDLIATLPKDNFYYRSKAGNLVSKAFLFKALENYQAAETTFKEAINFYENNNLFMEDGYIKALNDLAVVYSYQKKYDLALKTLDKLKEKNDKYLKSNYHNLNYYNNVGTVHKITENYEEAKKFYEAGLAKAIEYKISYYEVGFKENLVVIYEKLNEKDKKDTLQKEVYDVSEKITKSALAANQQVFESNQQVNNKIIEEKESYLSVIISVGCISILFLLSVIFYINRVRKNQSKKFQKIIKEYQKDNSQEKETRELNLLEISEQKEKEILTLLNEFEDKNMFLDKNMTLSSMAVLLNTNTKYLTNILKKHRECNYNDYLNKMRIRYIVDRLINEKDLAKYKLDHIADLAGFSSHSRFTTIFKKEIEMSPSQFLKEINKTENLTLTT